MSWALIIATIGRSDPLSLLLASIAQQCTPSRPIRVILVDQNTDIDIGHIVTTWKTRLDIEHIRIPPRGVSQARNAGLSRLDAETHVAFPDDDSFFDAHTLANAESLFSMFPEAGAVLGTLHLPEEIDTPGPAPTMEGAHFPSRIGLLKGAGMPMQFFRRTAVDAAGKFDETLGPGGGTPWLCGEDSDYLLNVVDAGFPVVKSAAVRVFHPAVDATSPGYAAKAFGYGRGRMRIMHKHRYPHWFRLASIAHPLLGSLYGPSAARRFRWHLFRGRLREFILPHRPGG